MPETRDAFNIFYYVLGNLIVRKLSGRTKVTNVGLGPFDDDEILAECS